MPGYQILTLDFEKRGVFSWLKIKAALATQKVPTFSSQFVVSCGSYQRVYHG